MFRIGGTTLITRLIDGEFLNYRAAIPKEFEHEVSADRQELIQCIERVSLIVSEKLKNPIRFHFDGSYVQMSCVTAIGKSYDECRLTARSRTLRSASTTATFWRRCARPAMSR